MMRHLKRVVPVAHCSRAKRHVDNPRKLNKSLFQYSIKACVFAFDFYAYPFKSCSGYVVKPDRSRCSSNYEETVAMQKTEIRDEDAVRARQDRFQFLVVDWL